MLQVGEKLDIIIVSGFAYHLSLHVKVACCNDNYFVSGETDCERYLVAFEHTMLKMDTGITMMSTIQTLFSVMGNKLYFCGLS